MLRFSRAVWTWLSRPAYRGAETSVIYKQHPQDNFFRLSPFRFQERKKVRRVSTGTVKLTCGKEKGHHFCDLHII